MLDIEDVQRLRVEPGEILAFKVREDMPVETVQRIGDSLRLALPGVPVVVYTGGEFVVISEPSNA